MFRSIILFVSSLALSVLCAAGSSFDQVRPILERSCVGCHGEAKSKGGLRLDTREGFLAGGENEEVIDLENLPDSHLLHVINLPDDDDDLMPPLEKSTPLTEQEKQILKLWILAKAPFPSDVKLTSNKKLTPTESQIKNLKSISAYPSVIQLDSKLDSHAPVIYGGYENATTQDLTEVTTWEILDPSKIKMVDNIITPLADGSTVVKAVVGGKTIELQVHVKNAQTEMPISFTLDVMPTITALGCNTGSCHGSARGQDGFHLSLFGYDPEGDHYRITKELPGRRINTAIPENSLLLTKATGKVPHTGGKLTTAKKKTYQNLLKWLQSGARYDSDEKILPVSIEIFPKQLVIQGSGKRSQLTVIAKYADGTDRDVTELSSFTTSNESCVKVNEKSGKLTSAVRGEAIIMARFHTFTEVMQAIVIPENSAYQQTPYPANNYIDGHIANKLHKLRINPSDLCSDEVFLRRVFIDLVGHLPSTAEREKFLTNTEVDKRAKLVGELIARPEFIDIWVMKWSELLQIRTFENAVSYKAVLLYHQWLREQFLAGKPFNKIIHEVLTSKGGTFQEPATNFYQVEIDTLKLTENIAQTMMGTRIQCAQCHNHPFDRWTMNDYYSFTAFFSQVQRKPAQDPREQIIFDGGGEILHPVTKKNAIPKFLGGNVPDTNGKVRRVLAADWLTAPENPWFARNVSNIIWAHFFGSGIINPVDDIRVSNPPSNPELIDALAKKFVEGNFSIQMLVRDICNSRTYQLTSAVNETNKFDETNFSHSKIRRIRAEFLLDSIAQVTRTPNKFKGLPLGTKATRLADGNSSNYFLETFGRASRTTVCSCEVKLEPNLSQALHLINGDSIHQRIINGKVIPQMIAEMKTDHEIIQTIYLSALTREPTATEMTHLLDLFKDLPDQDKNAKRIELLEDIFWAVLNSKEYIFNH